ncbi:MRN complex-interacting protein-like [Anneissia japonica]|uniref:MRN complex-interacting protein-like n=1 Tax=Anneissia japonica TaxID=1529436 RepID=UPI0014255377|nr:MRN complex-interacting protein-like [Anneissia japonica]
MPQVFHVIRCYDCQTFQVQQEYGSGSGVDCRKLVQSLNMQKVNTQKPCDTIAGIAQDENEFTLIEEETKLIQTATFESASSKWNQFLDEKNDSTELDVGSRDEKEDMMFTTDRDVMLREERELRKLRRQEWKAGKRKRNYESKPYIINKNAKQQPVTKNYSRKCTLSKPEQQNSFGNAHVKSGYVLTSNQIKQTYSANLSTISDDRQHTMTTSHFMNSNPAWFQNPSCKQILNKNSKKHDLVNKSSTSKWSKFLEVNEDESTDDEDDCDNGDYLKRRDQLHINIKSEDV